MKFGYVLLLLMSAAGGAYAMVLGRRDSVALAIEKSSAEVKSPQTVRRHGVMLGSVTPKRCSMN